MHASAILFCTVGYGGTSTHAIAKEAGIRQASVYHYFAGKHEILLRLLLGTVAPSLDAARALLARTEPAAVRLWALCASDVRLLAGGDVNLGSLYLLPELEDERFGELHALRAELQAAYSELIAACSAEVAGGAGGASTADSSGAAGGASAAGASGAEGAAECSALTTAGSAGHAESAGHGADAGSAGRAAGPLAGLVLSLVESVILQRRRDPGSLDDDTAGRIADAALKVIDLPASARVEARERGTALLADLG